MTVDRRRTVTDRGDVGVDADAAGRTSRPSRTPRSAPRSPGGSSTRAVDRLPLRVRRARRA